MNARQLLAAYVLLNVALYLYSAVRYGVSPDVSYLICAAVNALILLLLIRGSRGAWLLSFLGSSLALAFGVGLLVHEDVLTFEWAFVLIVYALQVLVLFAPGLRDYVRRVSYERAIRAHRSW